MTNALSINNLSCHYDGQAVLESLSLNVKQGEIVCLLGASGCGKTTLLKAIAGLLPLHSGLMSLKETVIDDGHTWTPPEQRNIGMIFQDYALFPHLTVAENIAFGLKGQSEADKAQCVEEMLALIHLTGFENRYPHQLSGGQQQRVAIARSLAYKPDLLLLDEPFSNIDTQVRHELIQQIRTLFKSQGVTAIFVTHSREEAFAFADKMAVMNNGSIEQYGTATELYSKPSSQFVANFLGGASYLKAVKIQKGHFNTSVGQITATAQQQLSPGDSCEILLRPQDIELSSSEPGTHLIDEVHFMGEQNRYVVSLDGKKVTATSTEALNVGQAVSIKLNKNNLLAYRAVA